VNKGIPGGTEGPEDKRFYHGTRAELRPGDLIGPSYPPDVAERGRTTTYVYLTPNLDEAIWEAELAVGEGPGRVYRVEPIGQVGNASDLTDRKSPGHPSMSCCSREPLRVTGEVTEWSLYHGTRADLKPGDLIEPAITLTTMRTKASYVYLTRT
jgi:rifampin ADP-ribosylating transferase